MGNCLKKNKKIEVTVEIKPAECFKCFDCEDDTCVSSCCVIQQSVAPMQKINNVKETPPVKF